MARPKLLRISEIESVMSPVFTPDAADRLANWRFLAGVDQRDLGYRLRISSSVVSAIERGDHPHVRFTFAEFADAVGGLDLALWIITGRGKPPLSREDAIARRSKKQTEARAKQWDSRIEGMLRSGYKEAYVAFTWPVAYDNYLKRKKLSEEVKAKGK